MGTAQVIIVFFALMALIALVTIGIDWVGKPLRNRRFIPRIYRFEDEKLPIDAYGNTSFGPAQPLQQAPPVLVAQRPPQRPGPPAVAAPRRRADQTVRVDAASQSAFSDTLAAAPIAPSFLDNTPEEPAAASVAAATANSDLEPAASAAGSSSGEWVPGMALDATIDDRKPNLALKAERFWRSTAQELHDSHFDAEDFSRMRSGKAPRRHNPRTGRTESMELTGLRRASSVNEVRMSWPDRSVDPWNA